MLTAKFHDTSDNVRVLNRYIIFLGRIVLQIIEKRRIMLIFLPVADGRFCAEVRLERSLTYREKLTAAIVEHRVPRTRSGAK